MAAYQGAGRGVMDDVSPRLVDQRIRNRIIEQLECLANGDAYVRDYGPNGYLNAFFDWMPIEDRESFENAAMTSEEVASVEGVRALMMQASNLTPHVLEEAEFISSGWPKRIAEPASDAVKLLTGRGRFSESVEENEPTVPSGTDSRSS